jgi:uncharacterized RDD family membrane protein YckC
MIMEQPLPPGVDLLIEQLESPDSGQRISAIAGLARIDCRDERVIQALVKVVRDDPDRLVRREAQYSISILGDPSHSPDDPVSAGPVETSSTEYPTPGSTENRRLYNGDKGGVYPSKEKAVEKHDWSPTNLYVAKATFWQRFAALFLDIIILGIASSLVSRLLGPFATSLWLTVAIVVLMMLIYPIYFICAYSTGGQTIGKKILGIKVISKDGLPLNWTQGITRSLGYTVSGIPFYLGYLWSIWDAEKQTWHDKIAGTYVVEVYVDREYLLGGIDPSVERRRQKRWLLGFGLGIPSLLLLIGFAGIMGYFLQQGVSEIQAMGPWPGADVAPEELVTLDLSDFGLKPDKVMDARDEEWSSEGSYQKGAYVTYKAGDMPVVAIWALRYPDWKTASRDYSSIQQSASLCGGPWKTAYVGNRGIVVCGFSNGYSKIWWNDQWIISIDAYLGRTLAAGYPSRLISGRWI